MNLNESKERENHSSQAYQKADALSKKKRKYPTHINLNQCDIISHPVASRSFDQQTAGFQEVKKQFARLT